MNAECHTTIDHHDFRTIEDYLRERIRRGLRAGYVYIQLLIHLQKQFVTTYKRYVRNLAEQDEKEEKDNREEKS